MAEVANITADEMKDSAKWGAQERSPVPGLRVLCECMMSGLGDSEDASQSRRGTRGGVKGQLVS